jgi:hypothetical protein
VIARALLLVKSRAKSVVVARIFSIIFLIISLIMVVQLSLEELAWSAKSRKVVFLLDIAGNANLV